MAARWQAKPGHPVRRGFTVEALTSLEYWIIRLREGFAEVEQIDGVWTPIGSAREVARVVKQ
jgi:hypothetical protein